MRSNSRALDGVAGCKCNIESTRDPRISTGAGHRGWCDSADRLAFKSVCSQISWRLLNRQTRLSRFGSTGSIGTSTRGRSCDAVLLGPYRPAGCRTPIRPFGPTGFWIARRRQAAGRWCKDQRPGPRLVIRPNSSQCGRQATIGYLSHESLVVALGKQSLRFAGRSHFAQPDQLTGTQGQAQNTVRIRSRKSSGFSLFFDVLLQP